MIFPFTKKKKKNTHLVSRFGFFASSSVQTQKVSATAVQNTRTAICDRNCKAGEVVIEIRGHFVVESGERRTGVSIGDHGLSITDRRSGGLGGGGGSGDHRFWSIRSGACCVRRDAGGRSTGHRCSSSGGGGGSGRPSIGRVGRRVVLVSVGRPVVVEGRGVRVRDAVGRRNPTGSRTDRVGQLCRGCVVRVVAHVRVIRVGGVRLWLGRQFGGRDLWAVVLRGRGPGHENTEVTGGAV